MVNQKGKKEGFASKIFTSKVIRNIFLILFIVCIALLTIMPTLSNSTFLKDKALTALEDLSVDSNTVDIGNFWVFKITAVKPQGAGDYNVASEPVYNINIELNFLGFLAFGIFLILTIYWLVSLFYLKLTEKRILVQEVIFIAFHLVSLFPFFLMFNVMQVKNKTIHLGTFEMLGSSKYVSLVLFYNLFGISASVIFFVLTGFFILRIFLTIIARLRKGRVVYEPTLEITPNIKLQSLKVIVLGQPQVGKTALYRALRGNILKKHRDKTIPGTKGIESYKYYEKFEKQSVSYIRWMDFAGQPINRDIHKLFLTDDAYYLLVVNLSQSVKDNEIGYWLQSIRDKAPNAEIQLIATHLDRSKDILGLEAPRESSKLYRLLELHNANSEYIKVSNMDGTNINRVNDLLQKELQKTEESIPINNLYFEIEEYVEGLKEFSVFKSEDELLTDMRHKFDVYDEYDKLLGIRTLELMENRGIISRIRMGTTDDVIILNIDKTNKNISEIIEESSQKDGLIAEDYVGLLCKDDFPDQTRKQAANLMMDLLEMVGLAIPYSEVGEERKILIPYHSHVYDDEMKYTKVPDIFQYSQELFPNRKQVERKELSKFIFNIKSYDETLSTRILGYIHTVMKGINLEDVWRIDPTQSGRATELHALFYIGVKPVLYFKADNKDVGKYKFSLVFENPSHAEIIIPSLHHTYQTYNPIVLEETITQRIAVGGVSTQELMKGTFKTQEELSITLVRIESKIQNIEDLGEKTVQYQQETMTKMDVYHEETLAKIVAGHKYLYAKLDDLKNDCPRLIYIQPAEEGKILDKMKSLVRDKYYVGVICEKCFNPHIIQKNSKNITIEVMKPKIKKTLQILNKVAEVASIAFSAATAVTGTLSKLILDDKIPKAKLDKIKTIIPEKQINKADEILRNTSKTLTKIQEASEEKFEGELPEEQENTCEFLSEADPDKKYKDLVEKIYQEDIGKYIWVCAGKYT